MANNKINNDLHNIVSSNSIVDSNNIVSSNSIVESNILYEFYLDRIDISHLNKVLSSILNKDLSEEVLDKFIIWIHNKCILDSK